MKKNLLFAVLSLISAGLLAQEQKEVITGPGYANDVYYSLETGTVDTVDRDNWDIGFVTQRMSVSILANNGSGVELYTYPNADINDWSTTLDISGIDTLPPMYNSLETFDMGAFNANTIPGDLFDYGWGRYNMTTHLIAGDSIFVIKTISGAWKKVVISYKNSMTNTWEFKYANLDGTEEQAVTLDASEYSDKYFIHYSIDSMKIQEREPAKEAWDMLFTKYFDYTIPYSVTGVLTNDGHVVAQEARVSGMDQATYNTYDGSAFTSTISVIGSDWKKINASYQYELIDTVVYFVKSYTEADSSYYKIYFTGFTGSSEGKYTFMQEKLIPVSTQEREVMQLLQVYPNPASDHIQVVFDHTGTSEIDIIDMTGRIIQSSLYDAGGFTNLSLDVSSLNSGIYFIQVKAEGRSSVLRFIKK
jgi:hypothetical protein